MVHARGEGQCPDTHGHMPLGTHAADLSLRLPLRLGALPPGAPEVRFDVVQKALDLLALGYPHGVLLNGLIAADHKVKWWWPLLGGCACMHAVGSVQRIKYLSAGMTTYLNVAIALFCPPLKYGLTLRQKNDRVPPLG